jgi:2,4-dienoyl-CoA reductase-like NADH-dependent reductase (Old Yellow Enzyme family)
VTTEALGRLASRRRLRAKVTDFPRLLSPLLLRGNELRNRVVFTAHTASFSQDGVPGARARDYYAARARGGAGLIVMEPLPVLPSAGVTPQNYCFEDERFVTGLSAVADAVHEHGALLVSQLYHLGPNADPTATMQARWGVSGGPPPEGGPGQLHEPDADDLRALVDGHLRAAGTALAAGVDGVECMFAYDTLVDGFMSDARNRRTDEYGGSFANRMRLAREILFAVRGHLGERPLLGVTVTASLPGYVEAVAHLHEECDVDYFGIGNGDYDHLELLMPSLDFEPGFGVVYAAAVKRSVPEAIVLAEGRINRPEIGESALADGSCDLVGMTRAQIADPELVSKTAGGRVAEIRECVALNVCVARRLRKFPIACVQNPSAGFESRPHERISSPLRVVVIGGGVAGLEAARTAAAVGHTVTLLEREQTLGGQVALVAELPMQRAHRQLVDWRVDELERLGVYVEMGARVDAETIAGLEPALAIVATGSEPDLRFAGAVAAIDVLRSFDVDGEEVVVIDEEGHRKASGVAELLARAGRRVTIVGDGVEPCAQLVLTLAAVPTLRRLQEAGVRLLGRGSVIAVEPHRVAIRVGDELHELRADVVVHAGRHRPVDGLITVLRGSGITAIAVGDAHAPGLIEEAIRSGNDAARTLAREKAPWRSANGFIPHTSRRG